jgi:hypothetical protein
MFSRNRIKKQTTTKQQERSAPTRPYLNDEIEALQREIDRRNTQETNRQTRN